MNTNFFKLCLFSSALAIAPIFQNVPTLAQVPKIPGVVPKIPGVDKYILRDVVNISGTSYDVNGFVVNWSAGDLEVLKLTNAQRQQNGLSPLRLSRKLSIAAMCHAKDMAEKKFDSHTGSNGSSVFNRVTLTGYQPNYWGENIYNQYPISSAANAVNWWMNSPGHRANILSPNFTEIGIGYSFSNNGSKHRYVQVFGTPKSSSTGADVFYCK